MKKISSTQRAIIKNNCVRRAQQKKDYRLELHPRIEEVQITQFGYGIKTSANTEILYDCGVRVMNVPRLHVSNELYKLFIELG